MVSDSTNGPSPCPVPRRVNLPFSLSTKVHPLATIAAAACRALIAFPLVVSPLPRSPDLSAALPPPPRRVVVPPIMVLDVAADVLPPRPLPLRCFRAQTDASLPPTQWSTMLFTVAMAPLGVPLPVLLSLLLRLTAVGPPARAHPAVRGRAPPAA